MSVSEKVAYLKGLADGLGLDGETKESKLFKAVIDTLEDVSRELEELSENALDIGDELDALSDDLADVEELLYDDDFDDDDDEDYNDFGYYDDEDGDECNCGHCSGDEDGGEISFEVKCPACSAVIAIDESNLAEGFINCSGCGEKLEFEFDSGDDESGE